MGVNPLHIRFHKVHRFIVIYYGNRYLVLFSTKRYDAICDRIRYLISEKNYNF